MVINEQSNPKGLSVEYLTKINRMDKYTSESGVGVVVSLLRVSPLLSATPGWKDAYRQD